MKSPLVFGGGLVLVSSALLLITYSPAARMSDAVVDDDGSRFRYFKALVVDGGSGKAAATWYGCDVVNFQGCVAGTVRELRSERWKVSVGDLLRTGGEGAFVEAVAALLDGDEDVVAVGLTGGVRAAVEDGLDPLRVDALFAQLRATVAAPTSSFRGEVLTGLDEARHELEAVRYVSQGDPELAPLRRVASLSGGGVSCQLATRSTVASLDLDLFAIQRAAARDGDDAAWAAWQATLADEVARITPGMVAEFGRAYAVVVLSMHASAAKNAGVPMGRLVDAADAVAKLDDLVDEARNYLRDGRWTVRQTTIPNPYDLDDATLRRATLFAAARCAAILRAVLATSTTAPPKTIKKDTPLYFSRIFPAARGSPDFLTADWALGLFLDFSGTAHATLTDDHA